MSTMTKGFTLVETMVAIGVLAIALVGPFVAIRTALVASYVARDQLIASQLAQEGMEYIRSVRDGNYLNGRAWLDGFNTVTQNRNRCFSVTTTDPTGSCALDPIRGDFHNAAPADQGMVGYTAFSGTGGIPLLNLNTSSLYTQQAGTATSFRRGVKIATMSANEVRITVTVSWTTSGQTYSVVVTDYLQDWL